MIEWLESLSKTATHVTIICGFLTVVAGLIVRNSIKVRKILYEVTTNSGKSMKDTLDKVGDKVHEIHRHQIINQRRVQIVFENSPTCFYECDADGSCTYVNTRLAELFGMPPEGMLGRGWLRAIETQSERIRVSAEWDGAIKQGLPYDAEYFIVNQQTQESCKVRTRVWQCLEPETGALLKLFGTLEEVKG